MNLRKVYSCWLAKETVMVSVTTKKALTWAATVATAGAGRSV